MNAAERHRQVMALFDDAAELEGAARESFLAAIDDVDTRRELRLLLSYDATPSALDPLDASGDCVRAELAAMVATAHDDGRPDTAGRYTIEKVLGAGGMGTVFLAEQVQPRRKVALKVLHGNVASARLRKRFTSEGEILARLTHPGIARVFEAVDGPRPYFVMELVAGVPLNEWAAGKKPDLRARVTMLAAIADAVDHAHRNGVVHRDLKPGNILITPDGASKVLDFGIARVMDAERAAAVISGVPLAPGAPAPKSDDTQIGEIIGTPAYMSPEQTMPDSRRIDHRSDVYALGVVGYELLTGKLPYAIDADLVTNLMRIRTTAPEPASRSDRSLRGDLEVILSKALAKSPLERYASAAALADDLRRWLASEPILARPPSLAYQLSRFARRNRALVIALGALLLALIIGAIATTTLWLRGEETQAELATRVDELVVLQAREMVDSDPTRAVEALAALSPDGDWGRAFAIAWDAAARGVSERTLSGHEAAIEWVDVAPDGAIASASFDGTVRVWREGGATILRGHSGGLNRAVWSPDGSRLASAGRDGSVRVWRDGVGRVVHQHTKEECEDLAWSPDGAAIASVGDDGVLASIALGDGTVRELVHADSQLSAVAWQGATIVASGKKGRVVAVDVPSGAVRELVGHKAEVESIAVAPGIAATDANVGGAVANVAIAVANVGGGVVIASGDNDGELRVWAADGTSRVLQAANGVAFKGLAFVDGAGARLTTVDRGGALKLWDVARGEARVLTTSVGVYRDVAVSADGAWLATGGDDRILRIWDLATFEPIELRGHRDAVEHVAFMPDDRIVSGGKDGELRVWRLPTTRARWRLASPLRAVAAHGDALALVDETGRVARCDLGSGKLVEVGDDNGNLALWSHDGARFVTARRDGAVHVRDRAGAIVRALDLGARPNAFAFAPDDRAFAVLSGNADLALIDVDEVRGADARATLPGDRANVLAYVGADVIVVGQRDGRVVTVDPVGLLGAGLLRPDAVHEIARLPGDVIHVVVDGDAIAAAGSDKAVRWRRAPDGGWVEAGATSHVGAVLSVAMRGDALASSGRDGAVKLYANGEERAFLGHVGPVTAVVLTDAYLISGGRDRTMRVWDRATGEAQVFDLFEGPIESLALASSRPGGEIDRVVAVADEAALTVWPLGGPRREDGVRAWLEALMPKR